MHTGIILNQEHFSFAFFTEHVKVRRGWAMELGKPPISESFILPIKYLQARSNNSYKQIALSPRQSKLNSGRKVILQSEFHTDHAVQ